MDKRKLAIFNPGYRYCFHTYKGGRMSRGAAGSPRPLETNYKEAELILERLMLCTAKHQGNPQEWVDGRCITPSQAKAAITQLISQACTEARVELAVKFIQKLDEANVPNQVTIPTIVAANDLTQVSVPIVSGEYWVNVHKALKYMREETEAALQHPEKGDK